MDAYINLKRLHKLEFFNDVKFTASLLLSLSKAQPNYLDLRHYYQTLVYYGDSLYKTQEYRKAESILRDALQVKRNLKKDCLDKTVTTELTSDSELRHLLYKVHWELKQYREAIAVLEAVPARKRSAQTNMALARLYDRTGAQRSAVTCYKEVVRECPMSFEALQRLLALGVKGSEVTGALQADHPKVLAESWYAQLVGGMAMIGGKDYAGATTTLANLESQQLRGSAEVLGLVGEAHFYNGHYVHAKMAWQRAEKEDPYVTKNAEKLALVLMEEKNTAELESLATRLLAINDKAIEPWLVSGFYCLLEKKPSRAIYLAQKALSMKSACYSAYLLKGLALMSINKVAEAVEHYREAINIAPQRLECYKALTEAYVSTHRVSEAIAISASACRQLGSNARTLFLYGRCLSKEPINVEKAKSYLEKSLKCDPTHMPSVYALAEILIQQHKFDKTIELLRSSMSSHSTSRLHQLLADCLTSSPGGGDKQEALHHYHIALQLDPTNRKAREGLEKLEKRPDAGGSGEGREVGGSYEVDMDNMEESEAEVNESDLGSAAWSDNEVV